MKLTNLLLVFCLVLLASVLCPAPFGNDKESAKGSACLSTVKCQSLGLLQYSSDHDGRYPFRDAWMNATRPYIPSYPGEAPDASEHCASLFRSGGYGYAFNSRLSRAKGPATPETAPLIYDSRNPIRNASDPVSSLPAKGRHRGKNTVGYADGHAKRVTP